MGPRIGCFIPRQFACRAVQRLSLVTGGNAGIGKETVRGLVARGDRVILAARDLASAEETKREIGGDIEIRQLDLSSLAGVRRFAADVKRDHSRLDVLVNNAGFHTSIRFLTPDGYESTFAVNHLAHFVLTQELLPIMSGGRVVTVASQAHLGARLDLSDVMLEKSWNGIRAYANSKLANILFALELAKRAPQVASFAVHPGSVRTGWARGKESGVFRLGVALASPFLISPARGAKTSLFAATAPELAGKTGLYLVRSKPASPSREAQDPQTQRALWELSERLAFNSLGA